MSLTIAHINTARGFRGGERQAQLLIDELAPAGLRQILVARRGAELADRMNTDIVEVRRVSPNPLAIFRATHGADIVHVHEGRSVYAAWLRSLVSGTPYILTRRVNNPIGSHWLAHRVYRSAGRVVAVAQDIANVVKRYDAQIRVEVIHSGSSGLVADRASTAAIREAFPGKLLVGHVGALDNRQKGQTCIIETARGLQDSHPQIHFVLVGGGDDEQMLTEAAADLSNLTFTGFRNNVGDYLSAFDIFILPSNKEGIGGILLDAMEHGKPVIASRVGGLPEIVSDNVNGILIDPARPDQLRAAILRLADSGELRQEMGARGREVARANTAAVMAGKYLALYQALV